jgi:hypothetical protein
VELPGVMICTCGRTGSLIQDEPPFLPIVLVIRDRIRQMLFCARAEEFPFRPNKDAS